MIQVQGLTRRYGDTVAVSGLSFSVQEGEIVGFLGPNGAGKTTTMNMITGCLRPTAGTAVLGGFDIDTDADQARKMIGYLPENPPLYPDMTVSEFLALPGLPGLRLLAGAGGVDRKIAAVTAVDTIPPTMGAKACEKLLTTPGRNTVARYSPRGASVPCHSDTAAARTGSQMLSAAGRLLDGEKPGIFDWLG